MPTPPQVVTPTQIDQLIQKLREAKDATGFYDREAYRFIDGILVATEILLPDLAEWIEQASSP